MSHSIYIIKGATSNGTIISSDMSKGYERGYIAVDFYSDAEFQNLVTPTAGILTFKASENGERYGTIPNGTVDATQVEYNRPNYSGSIQNIKAIASGILGAAYYRATITVFGG